MNKRFPRITLILIGSIMLAANWSSAQTSPEAVKKAAEERRKLMEAFRNRSVPRVVKPAAEQPKPAAPVMPAAPASAAVPVAAPAASSPFALPIPQARPAPAVAAQPEPAESIEVRTINPRLQGVALDILLEQVSEITEKTILRDPKVANVNVTLVTAQPVTYEEYLVAVDAILAMNNIALVPFRENYLKVVPANAAAQAGIGIQFEELLGLGEQDRVISKVVQLKYLEYDEVQTLITERLSPNAKVQPVERNNSIIINDSENNIRRVLEILQAIDRPAEVREAVKLYPIMHATAADIKSRLEELIAESQAELDRQSSRSSSSRTTGSATATRANVRGVIRPGVANTAAAAAAAGETPPPGLISGKVQIVADERTNLLIIISRAENDKFFEDMIAALDRKVDPEVVVRNYRLEFADAEEVAATLNDLIGAATSNSDPVAQTGGTTPTAAGNRTGQSISNFIRQRNAARTTAAGDNSNSPADSIADISETPESSRINGRTPS